MVLAYFKADLLQLVHQGRHRGMQRLRLERTVCPNRSDTIVHSLRLPGSLQITICAELCEGGGPVCEDQGLFYRAYLLHWYHMQGPR